LKRTKDETISILINVFIFLSLIGFLVSFYVVYSDYQIYRQGDESYQQIRLIRLTTPTGNQSTQAIIDFVSLNEVNADVVGWIGSDESEIDYPLVQGIDNEYYLTHLFTKEVNKLGSIFMDYRNNPDFSDRNTIIYGHNMKDGSMFSSLTNYKDPDYYNAYPTLPIYSPDGNFVIELFAGIVVDGSYESVRYNFLNDEDFMSYINSLVKQSTFRSSILMSPQDRIVTLVTCSDDYFNARYALYGKLTKVP
jgi:sortase B